MDPKVAERLPLTELLSAGTLFVGYFRFPNVSRTPKFDPF